jgi:hypothetical protein
MSIDDVLRCFADAEAICRNDVQAIIKNGLRYGKREPASVTDLIERLYNDLLAAKVYAENTHDAEIVARAASLINDTAFCPYGSFYDCMLYLNGEAELSEKTVFCVCNGLSCIEEIAKMQPAASKQPQPPGESTNEADAPAAMPQELQTPAALALLERARNAGFLDKNNQFIGTHRQMAYFAKEAAKELKLDNAKPHKIVYKPFEKLWKVKHLAQYTNETKDRYGNTPRQKELDAIFSVVPK